MSESTQLCDLCQLPIEAPDYNLNTTSGEKHFCCEGCQGIYRMLHEADIVADKAGSDASR